MILTDKPYIKTPPDDTPLMHYMNIHQLLSILKHKQLTLSTVALYEDSSEATLSVPSYNEVSEHLLWGDNTPVEKDEGYAFHKKHSTDKTNQFWYDQYWKDELWKIDTFGHLIYSFSRYFMFTHCWSIADRENILMWDRYRHQESTIAIKTTMSKIENALNESAYPLYVGKVQYRDYETEHITGFQGFAEKNLSDPKIIEELFYQPVFHKENLYQSEREARIIISYKHITESLLGNTYLADIPFYNENWGFHQNPDPYSGDYYNRPSALFFNEEKKHFWIPRIMPIKVDINELIEKIILSPYTASYALSLMRDMVEKYDIDPKKVINSSIQVR